MWSKHINKLTKKTKTLLQNYILLPGVLQYECNSQKNSAQG